MRAEDHMFNVSIRDLQKQVDWLKECISIIQEDLGVTLPPNPDNVDDKPEGE